MAAKPLLEEARENTTSGSRRRSVRCERVAYSCSEVVKRHKDTVHPLSFQNELNLSLSTTRRTAQDGGKWLGDETSSPLFKRLCDAEKDWHERSFHASGAFGGRENLPFNKPFSFFSFQPAVHYD